VPGLKLDSKTNKPPTLTIRVYAARESDGHTVLPAQKRFTVEYHGSGQKGSRLVEYVEPVPPKGPSRWQQIRQAVTRPDWRSRGAATDQAEEPSA